MANELSLNSLLTAFAVPEKSDWIKVARNETGLDDPIEKLSQHVTKNLFVLPFYDYNDLLAIKYNDRFALPPVEDENFNARYWENVPAVAVANPPDANKQALVHLAKGANGIFFDRIEKPDVLLREIDRSMCSTWFFVRRETDEKTAAELLHADARHNTYLLWEHTPTNPKQFLARSGQSRGLGLVVPRGTDIVEEITTALTSGVGLLDKLTDLKFSPATIGSQICFSFSVENDFFLSVAKFKAMRRLWYQVMRVYDVHDFPYDDHFLHARCEPAADDRYEPRGGLIANAVAALAAVCGGCNALTVFPDVGDQDLAASVARNISTILANEAHLDKVSDPFSGAYFLEALVHQIAQKAWTVFTNGPGQS
jgi:methylmalonyl-CoA mutase